MPDRTPRLPLINARPNKKSKGVASLHHSARVNTQRAETTSASALDDNAISNLDSTQESQTKATDLRLSGGDAFPFPVNGDHAYNRPWRPYLVGEGEFRGAPENDAITQAQAALAALEEGTLRLVKLVESDTSHWDRPRAA